VSQSEPIKKLQAFVEKNQQTQGKFTIGDEKVCCKLPGGTELTTASASQRVHACQCTSLATVDLMIRLTFTGPGDPEGSWEDGPGGGDGQTEGDEECHVG
jgi:hypothetical protein